MDFEIDHLRRLLEESGRWLSKIEDWNQEKPLQGKFAAALLLSRSKQDLLQNKFNEDTLLPDLETRMLFHHLCTALFLCFSCFPEKYDEGIQLSFYRYITETQVVLLGL